MAYLFSPSGGGDDVFRIRTYAVVCDGADPLTGTWRVLGEFQSPWDSFNLDSTIFTHKGVRYFVWAQREPGIETNSNLYIAPLKTPLTLAATRSQTLRSSPAVSRVRCTSSSRRLIRPTPP